jgi:leucyl aminopeptidase (aminopeptidase T)
MDQTIQETDGLMERYHLAMERIHQICTEETAGGAFGIYFRRVADFLVQMEALWNRVSDGTLDGYSLEQWQQQNEALYADILPGAYKSSYANPEYAVKMLGDVHGRILSFLYTEMRALIVYAFEQQLEETVVSLELFIEIYNCYEQDELPEYKEIQQIVYWFASDYSELFVTRRVREAVDPSLDFAARIVMESDLTDLRYLYHYGEYISEHELRTAQFLNSLPEEQIAAMADTYTEGYRIGFEVGGKDLSIKKTVNIRYRLGFERMIRRAIENFRAMGLSPVIYRAAAGTVNKKQHMRIGYYGAVPNKQFDYDHKGDQAIYLDRRYMERRLGVMRQAYEQYRDLARVHGGPAVVEVFGEVPFDPVTKADAYRFSEKQQQISVALDNEASQITNQYIIGKERSFTIIAFPVPEIGAEYEAIFRDTIRINTLDYKLYQRLQQQIIDVLDRGVAVYVRGCGANRTDLTVALKELSDPSSQTLFENCVADVNIPVGEVFTSPRLKGTNGTLHVSQVYLGDLNYRDLQITFTDGMITAYTCANFETDEENRNYIHENILHHHESLPLGEFAIGTNTTAYVMAKKYGIADRLPILIAEKMGPHFAVGDTCYSWQEDTPVYNPDHKEIIARDNEVSLMRKEDPAKAYFGCHTDITIPYEELGLLEVICADGSRIAVIRDGHFVLPGTEELNRPLTEASI